MQRSILFIVVKLEGENSSISIITCKDKNRTTVEYALLELPLSLFYLVLKRL